MFNLPPATLVDRPVSKKSFDIYTNTKQKRLFTDVIDKIRWANKLSSQTINLSGKDIQEIQIFEVTLKQKESVKDVLTIIDKAISYHIIFVLRFEDEVMLTASAKHSHPTNENTAVIDWTFSTQWFQQGCSNYTLNLKQNIDFVFEDFCKQLSGIIDSSTQGILSLVEHEQEIKKLQNAIKKLQADIKSCKQFNKKVELNQELLNKKQALASIEGS